VKITAPDLALLLGYMLAVVLFGVWMGRRTRSVTDYVVGARDTPWWVILFSIVATETSTVTFLSIPGFAFEHDLTWLQLPLGFVIGRLLVIALLLPLYLRGQLFTAYEVLEQRFGGATKRTASALFLVTRNLADGLRLFLTAIVLEQVAGIDLASAVMCIGAATIVYTFFGGVRAVLWTDAVQFLIYMAGAAMALWILCDRIPGGWREITRVAGAAGKLRVFEFGLDFTNPYVFWAGLIGGTFTTFGTHGADQMMVQRYLCARRPRDARLALGLSGVVVLAQFTVFLFIGAALWVFYQANPPAEPFARADRVFATFIVDEVPAGALGLLLGAVFAAAMSTLSSSLHSSATTAVHDLYVPLLAPAASPADKLRLTRRFAVLFGCTQIAVGIAGQWTVAAVVDNVMAIAGFTTGIILGVFILGVLTKTVQQRSALIGLVTGLLLMMAVALGTDLAWTWFSLLGSATTFAVGWAASRLPALR